MLQELKDYQFLFGLLGGSVVAYLLNLIVSHFRRDKKWLGFTIESRPIIESDNSELTVIYQNQTIKKLHSVTVRAENIGNVALLKIPIRLAGPKGSKIAKYEIIVPGGATVTSNKTAETELSIEVDLLQPKEICEIGLTVIDSSCDLQFFCRVAGLTVFSVKDRYVRQEFYLAILESLPIFPINVIVATYRRHLWQQKTNKPSTSSNASDSNST